MRRQELQRRGDDVIESNLRDATQWQKPLKAIRRDYSTRQKLRAVLSVAGLIPVREERGRDPTISRPLLGCPRTISAGQKQVDIK